MIAHRPLTPEPILVFALNELRIPGPLRELHLFAGCGGGVLGGMLLGHTCVCAVEIEPYRRKVLLQRQRDGILPRFPIWDDVRTFDGKPWRGLVNVVCGGFPCQDISVAGKGAGIDGESSGLWREMARVVCEVRPQFVFVENSAALLVRGLGTVLGDLAEMGYDAQWGVFSAADAGARHERKRLWIKASYADQEGLQRGQRRTETRLLTMDNLAAPRVFPQDKEHLPSPALLGSGHGFPCYVDRIKSIGDGQVPAVVRLAWETLA